MLVSTATPEFHSTQPASLPSQIHRGAYLLILLVLAGSMARLYRVSDPLKGFRPNDTAAMARNFYEGSMNILYPQVDWRGNSPGYVESEFPIYSFSIALLYRMFGVHEWLGKALTVGIYALSAILLFKLSRRFFCESIGLLAVLYYTVAPLCFFYTRVFQPDALTALCSLAGVYYFWIWTEDGNKAALALSVAGVCLAVLLKPNSLYLGLPLLYLSYRKFGWQLLQRFDLWLISILVVTPSILWYRHSFQLWQSYGNTFGVFGGWVKFQVFPPSLQLWPSVAKQLLLRLLFEIASPVGFLLMAVGFLARPPHRNYFLHWWAIGFGISALIVAKGNQIHDYYQLPVVFLAVIWMAYGTNLLWQKESFSHSLARAAIVAAICFVLGFSIRIWPTQLRIPHVETNRVAFASQVQQLTEPAALILMVRPYRGLPALYQHRTAEGEYLECDPVDFYRSHRKGWSLDDRQATPAFVETLHGRGAKYFATAFPEILDLHPDLKSTLDRSYTALDVNSNWAIYRLDH